MQTPKRYIHDRLVLLLLTANAFFAILTSVIIALRYSGASSEGFITQYRPGLGLSRYIKGEKSDILSFSLFVILILVMNTVLSIKVYNIRRNFSIVILAMGLLLILLALLISYSLLLLS